MKFLHPAFRLCESVSGLLLVLNELRAKLFGIVLDAVRQFVVLINIFCMAESMVPYDDTAFMAAWQSFSMRAKCCAI